MAAHPTTAERLTQTISTDAIKANITLDQKVSSGIIAKDTNLFQTAITDLAAAQSVVTNVLSGSGITETQITTLLLPAKAVVAVLDAAAQINPAISVAAGILKVLVQLELDRLDNDKHIALLYYTMSDLLLSLNYLDPVFSSQEGLHDQLDARLQRICQTMKDFGNFCDVYYKHYSIIRLVLSSRYKGQLTGFASSFTDHKAALHELLQDRIAVDVHDVRSTLSELKSQLMDIKNALEMKSQKEKDVEDMVKNGGGIEGLMKERERWGPEVKKMGFELPTDAFASSRLKIQMEDDLAESMTKNIELFNLKMTDAETRLEDMNRVSMTTLLSQITHDTYSVIEDEDVRLVWKEMARQIFINWRVTCKAGPFVDAINYHFGRKFTKYLREKGQLHPDTWTLHFLGKDIYHFAIGDVIDQDASGTVNVFGINRWFNDRPQDWSVCKWMAYWALGWSKNLESLRSKCEDLLDKIESESSKVPELSLYLSDESTRSIRLITGSIYIRARPYLGNSLPAYSFLDKCRGERMHLKLTSMQAYLQKTGYELDGPAAVKVLCGSHRVEHSIMYLIFLLLQHHEMSINNMVTSSNFPASEIDSMIQSFRSVVATFDHRYRVLLESWRQQRLDSKLQLASFASGLFEDWHNQTIRNHKNNGLREQPIAMQPRNVFIHPSGSTTDGGRLPPNATDPILQQFLSARFDKALPPVPSESSISSSSETLKLSQLPTPP